jgi:hypothetical protein
MPTPSRAPIVRPHPRLGVSELPAPGSVSPPEQTPPMPSRSPAGPSRRGDSRLAPRPRRRKRGRPRGKPLSAAELAARRANLQKAHAAPKQVIYRSTARRQAASRANIQKAITWRRSPGGNAMARLNALKHGAFARTLADTVQRLREDPAEFRRHLQLFQRVYVPQDEREALLVRRLAETTWRRLRLFHAQARWETDRLHALFAAAPSPRSLTSEETELRALALLYTLNRWETLFREAAKLESRVERLLRVLLWRRSGGTIKFKLLNPRRDAFFTELEKFDDLDEAIERLEYLTPRRRAQILAQVEQRAREEGVGG